jgi:hypothetical protein
VTLLERNLLAYEAFGLTIRTALPLPGLSPARCGGPEVRVEIADVRPRFSGEGIELERLRTAEGEVRLYRGSAGDLLLDAGELAVCHVSADGSAVACATLDPGFPAFQRLLLDTVLGTAALCRGYEGLHAAAVVDRRDRLVAIVGGQGTGKTTLAAELIAGGATLFADDLLFLDGRLAHPGPALMNLPSGGAPLGHPLGETGEERWVQVDREPIGPHPLWLVLMLERNDRGSAISCRAESSPAPLLAAALDSGAEPTRRQRRFEVLATVARTAHVRRLSVPHGAPAAAVAAALDLHIRDLR